MIHPKQRYIIIHNKQENMEYWLDKIRITLQSVVLFLIAFLTPMRSAIEVLLVVATFDFIAGLAGNVWTGKEGFRIGKAFGSLYKIIAYLLLIIVAHFAAANIGEEDLAWLLVKYITMLVSYWYFVNILSNLQEALPNSTGIAFLYLLMSLKILPLILNKMGLGGDDIQELADKARAQAEQKVISKRVVKKDGKEVKDEEN